MVFEAVIGQEVIKQRLISEADGNRLPHALLLTGPEGCGKMPMALALAQYLCCIAKASGKVCGTCISCRQWEELAHPDVHFVFPILANKARKRESCDEWISEWRGMLKKNPYFSYNDWMNEMEVENQQPVIYTKESDTLQRKLSLKSLQGGWRIVIIWLPEKMQEAGANKLLKLLEEPPHQTCFILVSEEPQKILGTILSRTQQIEMPRLTDEDISLALQQRMGIEIDESRQVTHIARGNFIKALETVTAGEGSTELFQLFTSLMRLAWSRKVKEMKAWSDDMAAMGRERQKDFLLYAQRMIRESFTANLHLPELNYMNSQEQQFAVKFAPFISERNAMGIMDELQEAQIHIEQNVNAKMVFFDLILQLTVLIKNH